MVIVLQCCLTNVFNMPSHVCNLLELQVPNTLINVKTSLTLVIENMWSYSWSYLVLVFLFLLLRILLLLNNLVHIRSKLEFKRILWINIWKNKLILIFNNHKKMIIEWSIVEILFNMMTNNGMTKKSKHTWIRLCQLYGFNWFL